MEDFYYAGGLRALLGQLALPGALNLGRRTVSGGTFGEKIAGVTVYKEDVILPRSRRCRPRAAWPCCAATSAPTARSSSTRRRATAAQAHRQGRGVRQHPEMQTRINDPALDVTADSVLVLRNAGPKGGPGMPE